MVHLVRLYANLYHQLVVIIQIKKVMLELILQIFSAFQVIITKGNNSEDSHSDHPNSNSTQYSSEELSIYHTYKEGIMIFQD